MARGSRRGQREAAALAALRAGDGEPFRVPAGERTEDGFTVRSLGASDRVYACPGCNQQVVGVAHVVTWPEGRPDDRRHWHTPCWAARAYRRPR